MDRSGKHPGGKPGRWLVPDDALNQMHRYRDALVQNLGGDKSRPVVEAFALYPSPQDQSTGENPYASAIAQVGIGAFPLVPRREEDGMGRAWLKDHLKKCLEAGFETMVEKDSVKIPVSGLQY